MHSAYSYLGVTASQIISLINMLSPDFLPVQDISRLA